MRMLATQFTLLMTAAVLLTGCGSLPRAEPHQQAYQLLPPELPSFSGEPLEADLMVSRLTSRPGYDSSAMAYRQTDYKLSYYANSRWAERPTRMLQPALGAALEQRGLFRDVVSSQSGIPADYRLDAELVRLEQDFRQQPSRTHLTLQFLLVRETNQNIILNRTLSVTREAPMDNAEGGVIAANAALEDLVQEMASMLEQALL